MNQTVVVGILGMVAAEAEDLGCKISSGDNFNTKFTKVSKTNPFFCVPTDPV
jgi:hypothetical protein